MGVIDAPYWFDLLWHLVDHFRRCCSYWGCVCGMLWTLFMSFCCSCCCSDFSSALICVALKWFTVNSVSPSSFFCNDAFSCTSTLISEVVFVFLQLSNPRIKPYMPCYRCYQGTRRLRFLAGRGGRLHSKWRVFHLSLATIRPPANAGRIPCNVINEDSMRRTTRQYNPEV